MDITDTEVHSLKTLTAKGYELDRYDRWENSDPKSS